MRTTLHINLPEFLDPRGCLVASTSDQHQLAEFAAHVVAITTHDLDEPLGAIDCRRQTGRRRCQGNVIASFDACDDICWLCPLCYDHGTISHWQGTFWDMTQRTPHRLVLF